MNTQHFRYAVEVERTGSISQAAENLYISQPTISKVIKELEDTLGITIFRRTPRGTVATEKGAQFLAYAREALLQVDKMERLSRPDEREGHLLSAALPHADYLQQGLMTLAADIRLEEGARLSVDETDAMQALSGLLDGRYRLAVIRYPAARETYFADYLKNNGLISEVIWTFEPLILTAQDGAVAAIDRLSEEKLEGFVEIESDDGRTPYLTGGEDNRTGRLISVSAQSERLAAFLCGGCLSVGLAHADAAADALQSGSAALPGHSQALDGCAGAQAGTRAHRAGAQIRQPALCGQE